MSSLLRILFIALAAVILVSPGSGQGVHNYSPEVEKLFQEGVNDYAAGRFASSASAFQAIVTNHSSSHRITAAYVMWGMALVGEGENLEASRVLKTFLAAYPGSTYTADAHLVLGQVYTRIGRRQDALGELRMAWRTSAVPMPASLLENLVASMDTILDASMTPTMVRRLITDSQISGERAYYWLRIAEKEADQENIRGAVDALDTLDRYYPAHPFGVRSAAVRSRLSGSMDVKIAALLPLMRSGPASASKEVAGDVYDGIVFALEQYGSGDGSRVRVTLETRDTERDPELAGRLVRELAGDPRVIAIVGPIFSSTTGTAAAVAQTERVTLISPTANANGIAAAGPYVFQANPDYSTRGRAMARYAVLVRGFRTVATLFPQDAYGKLLAEAFSREAEALGAKVVAQESYPKGATDLKEPLSALRRASLMENAEPMVSFSKLKTAEVMKLLDLGMPKKRIDSLMAAGGMVKATDLLGPNARTVLDSIGIPPVYDLTMLDSLEAPATGIQALYIPIRNGEEVGVVSAQVFYYNVQTQVLGSGEWSDITELSEHRRYCTGVLFETDTYVDTAGDLYRDFAARFAARFKKSPSQNALFGYDTAEMVLQQIRNGASTRPSLARALSQVKDFRGLHSRIGFGEKRVNTWLSIMQFDGKTVKKIDEVGME